MQQHLEMEEEEVGIGRRRKTYPKPVRHLRKEGMLQIKFFFQKTKEGKKRMRKVSGLLSKQTTYDLIISNQKREEQLWPNLFPIFALQLGFNHEENYRLFNLFGHIKNNHIYHDMKTGCCGFEKLIIFSRQSILKKVFALFVCSARSKIDASVCKMDTKSRKFCRTTHCLLDESWVVT